MIELEEQEQAIGKVIIFGIPIVKKRRAIVIRKLIKLSNEIEVSLDNLTCDTFLQSNKSIQDKVLNLITSHETKFFRYRDLGWEISEIAKTKKSNFKYLSAGCSTGEEAYSVTSSLLEENVSGFSVVGTDICRISLQAAVQGAYKELPIRFFSYREKMPDGQFLLSKKLRGHTNFYQSNLLVDSVEQESYDVISCLNTLMYYCNENRLRILKNLINGLKRNGSLIINHLDLNGYDTKHLSVKTLKELKVVTKK